MRQDFLFNGAGMHNTSSRRTAKTFQSHTWEPMMGDSVINTNQNCKHKGSVGIVVGIDSLDADAGKTVTYCCTNSGDNWYKGDLLTKTMDQLSPYAGAVTEGTAYHLGKRLGIDRPIYRPGTELFFEAVNEMRLLSRAGVHIPGSEWEQELLESDLGRWGEYNGKRVPLDFPYLEKQGDWSGPCETCADHAGISEAKYKGKEVELGKPKRGSGGKAYVYVRDPKTGNVKKVSFGSSMPDAMGSSETARKRRKSFGDRHNCSDKKDRTKSGYWACRATKFFGRNIPGWW